MTDDFSTILRDTGVSGFLRDYVEHTRDMEAPTSFHFFTGLTVLGAVLKRRVYFDQIKFKLFPCYQTLLAGPAGEAKKTTAARYGVGLGLEAGELNTIMSSGSPERLWDRLHQISMEKGAACGMLYAGEMATLVNKRDYGSTMIEVLMVLFECNDLEPPRETFAHKSQPLKNVAVSALFCSNEDMLVHAMPPHAMKGGLPSRMLTIYEPDSGGRETPFLDEVPTPALPREKLVADLTRMRFVTGKVQIDPKARKWYRAWYSKVKNTRKTITDESMKPFFSRYPDHMVSVAIGLSVSEMEDTQAPVIIQEHHFLQADAVLEYMVARMPRLYRFLAMGPFGEAYAKVYSLVTGAPGQEMSFSELGRVMSNKLNRKQLQEVIDTMVQNGEVLHVRKEHDRHFVMAVRK